MHWLWMGAALAASPYKGRDGDVVVKHTMAAEPERIYAVISDLQKLAEVVPEPCIEDWAFGVESTGERATARGTFHFKAMRRRLTLGYSDLKPDRGVIIEGEGKKGTHCFSRYLAARMLLRQPVGWIGSELRCGVIHAHKIWLTRRAASRISMPLSSDGSQTR